MTDTTAHRTTSGPDRRQGPAAEDLVSRRLRNRRRHAADRRRTTLRGRRPAARPAGARRGHRQRRHRHRRGPSVLRRDRRRLRARASWPRARERAAAEGYAITFDEGDAEDLPYGDASFDAVLSTFGVMFSADQERVAAELLRVLPAGRRHRAWPTGRRTASSGSCSRRSGRTSLRRPGVASPAPLGHRGARPHSCSVPASPTSRSPPRVRVPLPVGRPLPRRVPHVLRPGAQGLRGPRRHRSRSARHRPPPLVGTNGTHPVGHLVIPATYLEVVATRSSRPESHPPMASTGARRKDDPHAPSQGRRAHEDRRAGRDRPSGHRLR